MADWTVEYFGPTLVTKSGEKPTTEVLNGKSVVALYFSAHWVSVIISLRPTHIFSLIVNFSAHRAVASPLF